MVPRYDCPKHTLPLTASVTQQSLEARNFCKGPLLPGIRKTVIHHPPLVTIIVAPCTHLSHFLFVSLQPVLRRNESAIMDNLDRCSPIFP